MRFSNVPELSFASLDGRHGRLYIANLSANRVEVMNTGDRTLAAPLDVSKPPSSVAMSPDKPLSRGRPRQ